MFLEAFRRRRGAEIDDAFPWTVPALGALREMRFTAPVTFLMGENGCGKSTLLEALAVAVEASAAGAEEVDVDATLSGPRRLADAFETVERGRPRAVVFFRAEDSFGFTKRIEREMKEINAEADAMLADTKASEFRRQLGAGYVRSTAGMLAHRYGADPHARSHGETFLGIVRAQVEASGLVPARRARNPALADARAGAARGAARQRRGRLAIRHCDALADFGRFPRRINPRLRGGRRSGDALRGARARPRDARLPQRPATLHAAFDRPAEGRRVSHGDADVP
jgi:predicted ATPase